MQTCSDRSQPDSFQGPLLKRRALLGRLWQLDLPGNPLNRTKLKITYAMLYFAVATRHYTTPHTILYPTYALFAICSIILHTIRYIL